MTTAAQISALGAIIDHARRHSPFYAAHLADVPERLSTASQVPLLDQTTFWAANGQGDNTVLAGPMDDGVVFKSGGTTGAPKFSVFSNADWRAFTAAFGAGLRRGGVVPGERIANVFYGGQLYASFLFINRSIEEAGAGVSFPLSGSAPPEDIVHALETFDIRTLAGVPTSVMALLDILAAHRPAVRLERILYGGESMFDDQVEAIRAVFPDCAVQSIGIAGVDYGELGWFDPATCARGEHHSFTDSTLLEVVDPDSGQAIDEPGVTGRLVLTNLHRRLMPIIRYPVGDLGMWMDEPGTPDRRFRLLGRAEEGARLGPVTLYVDDVARVLADLGAEAGVRGFQVVVEHAERRDRCTLRLASDMPDAAAREALGRRLLDRLGEERPALPEAAQKGVIHPLCLEWVGAGDLEVNRRTGKLLRVIDRRLVPSAPIANALTDA